MTHRIVILGAGYAGRTAAKRATRLLRRTDVEVTLVNRTDRFVERVRLHQLAAGQDLPARPLPPDGLVVATVTAIDLAAKTVHLGQTTLDYDTLVYALGSGPDLDSVPGVRAHAYAVADLDHALRLRDRVPSLDTAIVVGGGLTGIETAAELAETNVRVTLASHGPVGGWLSKRAQRHLHSSFERMGIDVCEGRVVKVGAHDLLLADGRNLQCDAVVWAAGFRVPPLAAEAGLAVDRHDRIQVDDRLRSLSHPDVYAIGDAAVAGARMACQTGMPMGAFVASDMARALAGRESKPVRFRYVWQNISLGRRDGVTQFTRFDDTPRRAVLTGRASARFKEFVTRGAAWAAN
ncbi:NAD(P)/FAD-dependent oxidoreductase [Actinocrispum wychmicini]|uniref:NADH dehydrogenase FAD-containing subunit n=1 Tax=Actinocrispum wychmicini TaxID=1213861 RepID=A0A4R2J802_9PSEU|nr:FAD-dependent oxidoreductase [Actinocrispum wychmicini]TCO52608.1 NADH dehydrogenase FAD-containing subunit [Actinocrispum wychmicini]